MAQSQNDLPNLAEADWLNSPTLKAVFAVLGGCNEVRVVGGAVRDTLLGRKVGDIDLATTRSPDEIMQRSINAGLKAVRTGGDHGTVSVIVTREMITQVFEVTPLRIDVKTDGRHAIAEPTQSWALDAQRRDFTLNALYCDEAGKIYDYVGGYQDVIARRVRFIGSAEKRIREDFLRILRFFRFAAVYADGVVDGDGVEACVANREGLSRLSAERIKQELFKLFLAPYACRIVQQMVDVGIMDKVLPGSVTVGYLVRLADIENSLNIAARPLPRLAALGAANASVMASWRKHLKLSNKESRCLIALADHVPAFSCNLSETTQRQLLYELGEEIYTQCVLLAWSLAGDDMGSSQWREVINLAQRWCRPVFPLKGQDVVGLGVAAGPEVGEILSQLEQAWIEADFELDKQALNLRLKSLVQRL